MGVWAVFSIFGVVFVIGEVVLFGLFSVYVVVVVGGRFLGSGWVGGGGRSIGVMFCWGVCCWGRG